MFSLCVTTSRELHILFISKPTTITLVTDWRQKKEKEKKEKQKAYIV